MRLNRAYPSQRTRPTGAYHATALLLAVLSFGCGKGGLQHRDRENDGDAQDRDAQEAHQPGRQMRSRPEEADPGKQHQDRERPEEKRVLSAA